MVVFCAMVCKYWLPSNIFVCSSWECDNSTHVCIDHLFVFYFMRKTRTFALFDLDNLIFLFGGQPCFLLLLLSWHRIAFLSGIADCYVSQSVFLAESSEHRGMLFLKWDLALVFQQWVSFRNWPILPPSSSLLLGCFPWAAITKCYYSILRYDHIT